MIASSNLIAYLRTMSLQHRESCQQLLTTARTASTMKTS
jgi:hypothetical protein